MSMDRDRSRKAGRPVWGPFATWDESELVWITWPDDDHMIWETTKVEMEYVLHVEEEDTKA